MEPRWSRTCPPGEPRLFARLLWSHHGLECTAQQSACINRRPRRGNCVLAAISQGMDHVEPSPRRCSGLVSRTFYCCTVPKLMSCFRICGSLTQWRCASVARTGLVSTSMTPDHGTPGNGLLLFFRVDDFDLAPWRFKGHALSSVVSKRSHTTIRTLERRIFAPRSGRILRYDQSALGLKCEPSATPTAADHHMN